MGSNCFAIAVIRPPVHVRFVFNYVNKFIESVAVYRTFRVEYSLEQGVFIYNFVRYESRRIVVTNLRQSSSDSPEPSKANIYNLLEKFRILGLVLDKKQTCVKHRCIISNMYSGV